MFFYAYFAVLMCKKRRFTPWHSEHFFRSLKRGKDSPQNEEKHDPHKPSFSSNNMQYNILILSNLEET